MRIGILQTGSAPEILRPRTGDYPDMFRRLLSGHGFDFVTYDVENMQFPTDIHDCDGWLITGSRHGVYEDHAFIPPLEDFIRKAFEAGIPIVGICFGHQIVAKALGGRVEKYSGGWAVGPQVYDFGGRRVVLNAWHQDQVIEKPSMAETVASSEFCRHAALVYGDRAFTVQAHPEYDNAFIEDLMNTRGRGVVPDALMEQARARFTETNSAPDIAKQIAEFFLAHQKQEHV